MRIIMLHSDFVEFQAIKPAVKKPEQIKEKTDRMEECLLVLTSVEKNDGEAEVKKAAEEIEKICREVGTKKVMIYPWAHLSSELADLEDAGKILEKLYREIKKNCDVKKAPFGWYKSFTVKVKGHPLSELSREIRAAKEESKALVAERKLKSHWYIVDTHGALYRIEKKNGDISGFDFTGYERLKAFAAYEISKSREVKKEPPHVKLMREQEIANYEGGSDPGNLKFYPKGRLIKALLEELITREMLSYGAMELETPIMYDYEHESLKKYLNRFPARQYVVNSPNKKLFLRFAACFGQFLTAKDAVISYKQLPVRLYEMAKCYRAEQRGEIAGLRRLRAFTMPDCHALCRDFEQAKEEMITRFKVAKKIHQAIGFNIKEDFELGIRVTKSFYNEHKDFINELVKLWGKPALLEMWDERFFYFVLKYEWNFVDNNNKAAALTTDQFDVENAEAYNINFIDESGNRERPIIMHFSPGAIERIMYALLEREYRRMREGKSPMLPVWLSPTQVRIIPVSDKYLKNAIDFANQLKNVRVDIDDSADSLSKKIRKAEKEWIPYIAVLGDKEVKSGKLNVRVRERKEVREMAMEELQKTISEECKGKPFRQLNLPTLLSKRVVFFG
ncbi:threonine--tRNA ligase [Candidatus Micrarchaeota archaeon]|nr:MAG: threonine--tRNA ligase [Candidatus Micrarchaeota archaeon]